MLKRIEALWNMKNIKNEMAASLGRVKSVSQPQIKIVRDRPHVEYTVSKVLIIWRAKI